MNKEEVFNIVQKHLLEDEKPSVYLNKLKKEGYLKEKPFNMLLKLEDLNQSPKYHPEGNVWIHTMMVVDEGAKNKERVKDKKVFMWSLLLHDLGKIKTTRLRKGRWTSYDHDKVGEREARSFLEQLTDDEIFINKVSKLVRYHMHLLYIIKNLPYKDEEGMLNYTDVNDLAEVFLSDRMGRGGLSKEDERTLRKEIEEFKNKYYICKTI